MEKVSIKFGDQCDTDGCTELATHVTANQRNEIFALCKTHHTQMIEAHRPEYIVKCPNCACYQGVN